MLFRSIKVAILALILVSSDRSVAQTDKLPILGSPSVFDHKMNSSLEKRTVLESVRNDRKDDFPRFNAKRNSAEDQNFLLEKKFEEKAEIKNPFIGLTHDQIRSSMLRGGVGDGGGSGVACFYTNKLTPDFPADAKDSSGRLTPYYRQWMNRIFVTDYMDSSAAKGIRVFGRNIFVEPYATETPEAYIERVVVKRIQPLAPRFASKLKTALHRVRRELWIPVPEGLPDLPDVGQTPYLQDGKQKECTSVQLVRRRESIDPVSGQSKVISIEFDPDLLEKIQTVNVTSWGPLWMTVQQGILLLHEALYSVGTSLGHDNSVKVRALTRILLEEDFSSAIQNNFQFLYLLYAHDFLSVSYFGFDPEALPENSEEYARLMAFGEILKRVAEHSREELTRQGFDCETFERQWPDLNCKIQGLQKAMSSHGSFFRMDTDIYSFYSEEQFERFSDAFSFLLTIPSRNDRPNMFMQEWRSDGKFGSVWPETMLEQILIKGSDDVAIMKSVCPIIQGRLKSNGQARGPWFAPTQSRNLKLQDIFLRKAVRYCRSKSAL